MWKLLEIWSHLVLVSDVNSIICFFNVLLFIISLTWFFISVRMPLKLDIKRKLTARSDRVKSCDLHPTEQWMLVSLYNGNVHIWNYESQQLVKSFEVCDLPVRAAVFVPRKNWVVTGSDDMQVSYYIMIYMYVCLISVRVIDAFSICVLIIIQTL